MYLIDCEYTFDRNKLIFYFTAEGRIDFRELVKDLAAIFKTRIELRQIGVRDEAKSIGGSWTMWKKSLLFNLAWRFSTSINKNGKRPKFIIKSN